MFVESFESRDQFEKMLEGDHPCVFVQFTASWCGPCKKISPIVNDFIRSNSSKLLCCRLDVDRNADLYSYLKRKRLINGIPCLYYYDKSNHSIAPTSTITGGSVERVAMFLDSIPV